VLVDQEANQQFAVRRATGFGESRDRSGGRLWVGRRTPVVLQSVDVGASGGLSGDRPDQRRTVVEIRGHFGGVSEPQQPGQGDLAHLRTGMAGQPAQGVSPLAPDRLPADQVGRSPPGACTTPSSELNVVTTMRPIVFAFPRG
jgi:hypothetical protein